MKNNLSFTLKDGMKNMDFNQITEMLSTVYWSTGIKKTEIIKGAENSALLVGAFTSENLQIGYARVVSDKTRFAYIMDVVVRDGYRRQGLGQAMVKYILSHSELKDVYQWMLMTRDAHDVYKKAGFMPITHPEYWLEIRNPRPDR